MNEDEGTDPSSRFEVRTISENHFAWLRTRLAVERTMMAYQRTAVSLIGFGVVAAVFSVLEYRWTLRYLWGGSFDAIAGMNAKPRNTPMYAISLVLALVGVFAFLAVLLRML
jgi:putative membrane protein